MKPLVESESEVKLIYHSLTAPHEFTFRSYLRRIDLPREDFLGPILFHCIAYIQTRSFQISQGMEPPVRTPFTSWDGLEDKELGDIKMAIRDIQNAKVDITNKQSLKGSFKDQEKKLKEETSKLIGITREWARRPNPTANQQTSLDDPDRSRLRKIYILIQEGLENPIRALDVDFVKRLRDLCRRTEEIKGTGPNQVKEAISAGREDGDSLSGSTIIMTDKEKMDEEGVFYEQRLSLWP